LKSKAPQRASEDAVAGRDGFIARRAPDNSSSIIATTSEHTEQPIVRICLELGEPAGATVLK
jgi:hypothetical protein